jgi:two-component system, chemotaxis family, response regulator Rcp1
MSEPGKQVSARVLVVDDNAPDVVLIGESLRERGVNHTLTHCFDGEQALKMLNGSLGVKFDVLILDLNMPKLGGLEVLAQIRSNRSLDSMPILVLTSSLVPGEQEQALKLGADKFLRKPSDLDEFLLDVGAAVQELVVAERAVGPA